MVRSKSLINQSFRILPNICKRVTIIGSVLLFICLGKKFETSHIQIFHASCKIVSYYVGDLYTELNRNAIPVS